MAVNVINQNGKANIVLVCEHASNYIPSDYKNLGLNEEQLQMHIAWDIGIAEVTKNLSEFLDAPAVIAGFSRLLIDANRALDQAGLIPEKSDNIIIPGNRNLSEDDINHRIDNFYSPFHQKTAEIIKEKAIQTEAPLILNMHSFTPIMNGTARKWHTGMLWNKDPRIAMVLIEKLTARGFSVGDNQPYSGKFLNHTMNTHGTRHGYPHVNIEIRQDQIDHKRGINKWSKLLAEDISTIRAMPEMSDIKHY